MNEEKKKKHKQNPADEAAGKWLDEQKALAPKRKWADRALIISLSLIIAVFGILIFVLPSADFSEEENRMLAPFPEFSVESLLSGEFTEGVAAFYSDRFPARNVFVGVKAYFEKLMLREENNGVIEGEDGYLIDRLEYTDSEYKTLETNLTAINKFAASLEANGVSVDTVILPRAIDVMSSKLPSAYDSVRTDVAWQKALARTPDAITCTELLKNRADAGEYVWYKTDHHYTTLGAYYVYVELGKTLGYTPYPIDFFTEEIASSEFYGTTYSSSGMKWADADTMTLFRFVGDGEYIVSYPDTTEESLSGFYDRSYFDTKDKYSAFLGGNRARTSIKRADGAERETILLVKDSFSHALAPFLALHFDVELVDVRYYAKSVYALAVETQVDRVLVIYGIDTLATSYEARRIAMGVK